MQLLSKIYQGPSTGTFFKHLRDNHPAKCAALLPTPTQMQRSAKPDFFKDKKMINFDVDVFMGKILKFLIKKVLPFAIVDAEEFEDLLEYLKKDVTVHSRRTIMRRLDTMYDDLKSELKVKLHSFKSKFSITCDVLTSKNQLSFFRLTIRYIDND